ncbi:response regulator [Flavobacteriaceae bacterium AU392]|nr:DNA-binding response regulator [Flavobacteriaceae bacterium]RKM83697.1 response regulator [Flavobacteriaceae bacterium AU392]
MKCIAIDDEPGALSILEEFIDKISYLNFEGSYRNPLDAIDYLHNNPVDLILLDINMPGISGIKLVESLSKCPLIIYTTAYSEYAVESYNQNAIDYLLKPITFNRFLKGIEKAHHYFKNTTHIQSKRSEQSSLFIKSGSKIHKIEVDDILYIKKDGHYVFFHTTSKKIICRMTVEQLLAFVTNDFIQTHRSYVVNRIHIDTIEKHQLTIKNIKIPIAKSFRKTFEDIF